MEGTQQKETLMPATKGRGRPVKAKKAPAPTSVRLMERLTAKIAVLVKGAPLTKNDVLQIVIDLGLEQLDTNPELLLERHMKLLQERMPPKADSLQ